MAENEPRPQLETPIPVVVHLSGKLRGTTERLSGNRLRIGTAAEAEVHFPADREPAVAESHAHLSRSGETYALHAEPGQRVWVNGEQADIVELQSGDVLEIGHSGPTLRFRLYEPGSDAFKSLSEAFSDCLDCARNSSEDRVDQARAFLTGLPRELRVETSPRARLGMTLVLLALLVTVGYLLQRSKQLQEQLERQSHQVRGVAELAELLERNALYSEDLDRVREELRQTVTETADRVATLEARTGAGQRVISTAGRSVLFLQGAYGFDAPDGRSLRLGVGADGSPLADPRGNPQITLEGDGPPLEVLYTGTGFVATDDGLLLTNRHVAVPWQFEAAAQSMVSQGFQPVMRRFVGYLPDVDEPFDVELVTASDNADLAVLRCSTVTAHVAPLALRETPVEPGDEVIVLGFPTGIQALLARADEEFVAALASAGNLDFWAVAQRLAKAGRIAPLATRGIVGQITSAYVVYDAETTSGGSGGPVLGLDGEVVAINAAILRQFGGSNLGVPSEQALRLLDRARMILTASPEATAESPVGEAAPEVPRDSEDPGSDLAHP